MHTSEIAAPVAPAAPGSPDPVDVVLRIPRELEVDHDRQILDVEAASGDVGGDEDPDLARLELLKRAGPLGLRTIGVNCHGVDAIAVQACGQPAGGQLGSSEHQHLAQVLLANQVGQQRLLPIPIHRVDQLANGLSRRVAGHDLDACRIGQDRARQAPDIVGEGG